MTSPAKVAQINVNPQGDTPKGRVAQARLKGGGVRGDKHHRRFHGGPMRAVCLYWLELIEFMRAQSHPIAPGSTGEDLTLSGLNRSELKSGVRLRIGQAQIELTRPTVPCHQITASFADGDCAHRTQKQSWLEPLVCAGVGRSRSL